jgi:hypothetical protein
VAHRARISVASDASYSCSCSYSYSAKRYSYSMAVRWLLEPQRNHGLIGPFAVEQSSGGLSRNYRSSVMRGLIAFVTALIRFDGLWPIGSGYRSQATLPPQIPQPRRSNALGPKLCSFRRKYAGYLQAQASVKLLKLLVRLHGNITINILSVIKFGPFFGNPPIL